jgi:molybdopterin converting factor small subunit
VKVTVVCFGALRAHLPDDAVGNSTDVELAEGARIADLVRSLGAPVGLVHALLVDGRSAGMEHALSDGAEVTLMPPFTGGAGRAWPDRRTDAGRAWPDRRTNAGRAGPDRRTS